MYAIGRAIVTAVIPSNSTFNGFHDHVGFAAGLYHISRQGVHD
jgi:hypothetical protein